MEHSSTTADLDKQLSFMSNTSSIGNMTNLPPPTKLPVKQPLNFIKIGFKLGEFLVSLMGSEEPSEKAANASGFSRQAEDGLEEVIE